MTCLKDRVLSGARMKFRYVGDRIKYADFQEKIFVELSGEKFQTLRIIYIKIIFIQQLDEIHRHTESVLRKVMLNPIKINSILSREKQGPNTFRLQNRES